MRVISRLGPVALVLATAAPVPVCAEGTALKCSIQCAVELVNGCCPARPDQSPIPAGGCSKVAECLEGCTNGDSTSCTKAGWLLHFQTGEENDDMRAIMLFDRGCQLGDGRACWLGMQRERASYKTTRNFEAAVRADLAACQHGHASACSRLSELHWQDGKYLLYADRACQLGSRDDCIMLVEALAIPSGHGFRWRERWGLGVATNVPCPTSEQKHRRACEFADHVPSCILLAYWDRPRQLPVPADELADHQWKLVFDRLDPLCKRGEASACHALAEANDELLDRPIKPNHYDPSLGPRLYARACELSDAQGCKGLGFALVRGRGIGVDRDAAATALRKACDLTDGEACVALSQITEDPKEASKLIREACIKGMQGPTGSVYGNVGFSEYPQPYSCSGARRPYYKHKSPGHSSQVAPAER